MRRILVLTVAVLLIAACGNAAEEVAERAIEAGGGGDVDIEFDEDGETGEIVIESDDGTQTVNVGGDELPDGLTVQVPDGYEVLASSSFESDEESLISATLHYPESELESLIQHFDDLFDGVEEVTKVETSLETGRQILWIGAESLSLSLVKRDSESVVEVSITELRAP
jgi:hypothetical protein